jgi:hypothetical protein
LYPIDTSKNQYYKINEIQNNVPKFKLLENNYVKTVEFGKGHKRLVALLCRRYKDKWNSFGFKVINGFAIFKINEVLDLENTSFNGMHNMAHPELNYG